MKTRGTSCLPNKMKKYLDGEQLFRRYWSMGVNRSINKLQKELAQEGVTSSQNGKTPIKMTIWKAMWRWAVDNPDEAYQIVLAGLRDSGDYVTPEQWEREVLEKRATAYQSKKSYRKLKEYYDAHSLPYPNSPKP